MKLSWSSDIAHLDEFNIIKLTSLVQGICDIVSLTPLDKKKIENYFLDENNQSNIVNQLSKRCFLESNSSDQLVKDYPNDFPEIYKIHIFPNNGSLPNPSTFLFNLPKSLSSQPIVFIWLDNKSWIDCKEFIHDFEDSFKKLHPVRGYSIFCILIPNEEALDLIHNEELKHLDSSVVYFINSITLFEKSLDSTQLVGTFFDSKGDFNEILSNKDVIKWYSKDVPIIPFNVSSENLFPLVMHAINNFPICFCHDAIERVAWRILARKKNNEWTCPQENEIVVSGNENNFSLCLGAFFKASTYDRNRCKECIARVFCGRCQYLPDDYCSLLKKAIHDYIDILRNKTEVKIK